MKIPLKMGKDSASGGLITCLGQGVSPLRHMPCPRPYLFTVWPVFIFTFISLPLRNEMLSGVAGSRKSGFPKQGANLGNLIQRAEGADCPIRRTGVQGQPNTVFRRSRVNGRNAGFRIDQGF